VIVRAYKNDRTWDAEIVQQYAFAPGYTTLVGGDVVNYTDTIKEALEDLDASFPGVSFASLDAHIKHVESLEAGLHRVDIKDMTLGEKGLLADSIHGFLADEGINDLLDELEYKVLKNWRK